MFSEVDSCAECNWDTKKPGSPVIRACVQAVDDMKPEGLFVVVTGKGRDDLLLDMGRGVLFVREIH